MNRNNKIAVAYLHHGSHLFTAENLIQVGQIRLGLPLPRCLSMGLTFKKTNNTGLLLLPSLLQKYVAPL